MMRTNKEIGMNAGIIWKYLDSKINKRCSYEELKHSTGLSDNDLNQAIGWLAREEKLFVEDDGKRLSLAFCPYF